MNKLKLKEILHSFFIEDIGERDATVTSIFKGDEQGQFTFIAKQAGTFCGEEVIRTGFTMLDEKTYKLYSNRYTFTLGDRVLISVAGVDYSSKRVEFDLIGW